MYGNQERPNKSRTKASKKVSTEIYAQQHT